MSEEEAFLAAVYADPDDDCPRLVYADWLDERGQAERAEFIRLQCRMEREGPPGAAEEDRALDLAEQHRPTWAAHLPQTDGAVWQFRRGLPEELEIDLADLLAHYADWSAVPRVRYLALYYTTNYLMREFAGRAWNPAWVGLQFGEEPKPWLHEQPRDPSVGVAAIALSPQAARLRELRFSGHHLGDGGVRALCESPYLAGLRVLEVDGVYVADPRLVERFGPRLRKGPW